MSFNLGALGNALEKEAVKAMGSLLDNSGGGGAEVSDSDVL